MQCIEKAVSKKKKVYTKVEKVVVCYELGNIVLKSGGLGECRACESFFP